MLFDDPYECAKGTDAVVLMTDWDILKQLDLTKMASLMRYPALVDLRGIYPPEEAAKQGFTVQSIGRSGASPQQIDAYEPAVLVPELSVHFSLQLVNASRP